MDLNYEMTLSKKKRKVFNRILSKKIKSKKYEIEKETGYF